MRMSQPLVRMIDIPSQVRATSFGSARLLSPKEIVCCACKLKLLKKKMTRYDKERN